jgi:hypothetical protein
MKRQAELLSNFSLMMATTPESKVTVLKKELRVVKEPVKKTELAVKNLSARILGLLITEEETPVSMR